MSTTAALNELKNNPELPGSFFAPPVLYDRDENLYLSQMPAIMLHLGIHLNLMPDQLLFSQAMKAVLDCNDVLCEITRNNGHQMWDNEAWKDFIGENGRFTKWLLVFEQNATRLGVTSESGWYLGSEGPTIADFAIWATFTTMEKCLTKLSPFLRSRAPLTLSLCDRLTNSNSGLAALIADTTDVYCGGFIEKSIRAMLEE